MANDLLSVWGTIGSVLLAILILLVMITIHEFGHYIVGKLLKFKIDEFSIGFGPAIFKRKRKKTGEMFAVRLIPLGGYCAFAGEEGTESEKEEKTAQDEPFEECKKETTGEAGASPAALPPEEGLPEEPVSEAPSPEQGLPEEPSPGEPLREGLPPAEPSNAGLSAANENIKTQVQSGGEGEEKPRKHARLKYSNDGLFTHMSPFKRIVVLVAGAFMNYLLALLLIATLFACYGQSLVIVKSAAVTDEYSAEFSFRDGDILISADGKDLYLTTDISRALDGKKQNETVTFVVARKTENGYKREKATIMLRNDVNISNSSDFTGVWSALGVGVVTRADGKDYYDLDTTSYHFGFFKTIGRAIVYSFKIAGTIFRVIGELLTGKLGLSSLGGPVTTITTTSQVVSAGGFRGFLEIAAFIGVNLAVVNLLPIPALDGIHAVGIVLLFAFAILVDVLQFV